MTYILVYSMVMGETTFYENVFHNVKINSLHQELTPSDNLDHKVCYLCTHTNPVMIGDRVRLQREVIMPNICPWYAGNL